MPVSTITTLTEYAQDVLAVAEAALATTTEGTPERSHISPAAPAFDCCPFLSVHVEALREASTSPTFPSEVTARRGDFGNIIHAHYLIVAVRCAPQMEGNNPPTLAAIEAAAAQVQEDGWALWNELRHAVKAGDIFDGCLGVHFDGGVPIREQGGCVGWEFRIHASIEGIPA